MNPALLLSLILPSFMGPLSADTRWAVHQKQGAIELYSEFAVDVNVIWRHLHDVQTELAERLDVHPSGAATQIILFHNRANFVRYLTPRIPEARTRKAIFFRNDDVFQIYAFRSNQLITDLRHEYVHAVLHQHLPFLPLWMDEGLAEFFEEPAERRNQSVRLSAVKWKSRVGWSPSLRELEAIPSAAAMTEDDYRDSWAWVTFLLTDSDTTRNLFRTHLEVIARGEAPPPFSQRLRQFDPQAENRINSYFRKFQFPLSLAKDQ